MVRRNALLAFVICGIAGVLIDVDHLISYCFVPEWDRHFLHAPLLIASCAVLVGLGAYLGGLLIRQILKRR